MSRMMYHHYILTLDENETNKRIYYKQKEKVSRSDWFDLLLKDFKFVGIELDEKK